MALPGGLGASDLRPHLLALGLHRQPGGLQRRTGGVRRQFAEQVGAGPDHQIAVVLDGAGWHTSAQLDLPEHLHLIPLPPYSPELQPAERLWSYSNAPLLNTHFSDLQALEEAQMARCADLQTDLALVTTIQAATHYHWWPADLSPTA